MKNFIKNATKNRGVILIFLLFVIIVLGFGFWFNSGLQPENDKVLEIIEKFTVDDYTLPYHIAERYLAWYNMRTFFFFLKYFLTLVGILASLMTVFYASMDLRVSSKTQQEGAPQSTPEQRRKDAIVFLSLLSLFFTISDFFIDSAFKADMSQHAWRELDICIMETIHETELSENEKNKIIVDKIAEMERYNELLGQ